MCIAYDVNKEAGVTYVVWEGTVTAEQWLSHVERLLSDPSWPANRYLHLTDLRRAFLDPTIDETVLETGARMFSSHPKISLVRTAIVAYEAFQKALLFERLTLPFERNVIVFSELDTACAWLGLNHDSAARALNSLRPRARDCTN